MKIVAGIDGGGTGTTLELWDISGHKRGRRSFGPLNLNSIGEEKFKKLLSDIFDVIVQEGECESVCIGAAGVSNMRVKELVEEIGHKYHIHSKLLLKGDQEIALYGAMSGNAGAILIAGTGSICTGLTRDGNVIRSGGWGHLIDDEGSGYALGRETLAAVVKAYDGRGEKTILTDLIREFWKIKSIEELIAKTYSTFDKSNIASCSYVLEQGASKGDAIAERIIQEAAGKLCGLVYAVSRRIEETPLPLSLMGGLLTHDTIFRKEVVRQLSSDEPGIVLKDADMDAASGAALWALRRIS